MNIINFFLTLMLVIVIHECGHLFIARAFGCRVKRFQLFFGKVFSVKPKPRSDGKPSWRDTEYAIGWLPLGGLTEYEDQPSPRQEVDENGNEVVVEAPSEPWYYSSKPAWQRLLISLAGVLFNLLTALAIFTAIVFTADVKVMPYRGNPSGMYFSPIALNAGFKNGDIPLSADGKPLQYLTDAEVNEIVNAHEVAVLRDHYDTVTIKIAPTLKKNYQLSKRNPNNFFMAYNGSDHECWKHVRLPFIQSVRLVCVMMGGEMKEALGDALNFVGIKVHFTAPFSHDSFRESVQVNLRRHSFIADLASYSIFLFFLNIIPIYPLDGGSAVFCIYEIVTGHKPSNKFRTVVGMIGSLIIIIVFWILPFFN